MSTNTRLHRRQSPLVLQWDGYSHKGDDRSTNEDRFEGAPWPDGVTSLVGAKRLRRRSRKISSR